MRLKKSQRGFVTSAPSRRHSHRFRVRQFASFFDASSKFSTRSVKQSNNLFFVWYWIQDIVMLKRANKNLNANFKENRDGNLWLLHLFEVLPGTSSSSSSMSSAFGVLLSRAVILRQKNYTFIPLQQ